MTDKTFLPLKNLYVQRNRVNFLVLPSYLPKPVCVGNRDVVSTVVPAASIPVQDRRKVRKVPVQVNILGIGSTIGPTIQQVTLKHLDSH